MTSEKTLREKIEEIRKREEREKAMLRGESLFKNPNKTEVKSSTPVEDTSNQPVKKSSFIGSFLKSEVLPIISESANMTASSVISGEIAPGDAVQSFKYNAKEAVKERVRSEFENWVNRGLDATVNKKLPFDVRYSSRPGAQPGPREADMTVRTPKEDRAMEEARKRGMIK